MSQIKSIVDADFPEAVLNSTGIVIVDVWAKWCGPCRTLMPVLEQIAEAHAGRVSVMKINADLNARITVDYRIRTLPTLLFFKDGAIAEVVSGAAPRARIEAIITALDG
jgi:thioredoxin 1